MTDASDIMKNPAAAAGIEPEPPQVVTSLPADPGLQKLLKEMPGLVGAIDAAIKDVVGQPLGFQLQVFGQGAMIHGGNTDPVLGKKAVIEAAEVWKRELAEAANAAANEG